MLRLLDLGRVDERVLRQSLAFSGFDNMRRLEAGRMFDYAGLSLADPARPDSFRVRRGVVGGYRDYVGAEDMPVVDGALATLDERYGYA